MARSRLDDAVGRVLGGRYRLVAPIGTGASASVYLAEDVRLRRRVAVKILHAALAEDEGFLRRFRAEARAAAALNHPNVMTVYDWGEAGEGSAPGGAFLVLELFSGGSLRDLLDHGDRLSPSQALIVGLQAARGLDHAHRRGLVHRDIKPANLLFDDEGRLGIADFGLARALAEAAWTEPGGALLGTVRYAAPEQARGERVDGKADVYALALLLVEAVTGKVPFAADTTIATLMARVDTDLPVPESLGPLQPILSQAGSTEPARRPDAPGLARALDGLTGQLPPPKPLPLAGMPHATLVPSRVQGEMTQLGHEPLDAPPPAVELASDSGRRRTGILALSALLLVLLLAGVGWAVAQARIPTRPVPIVTGQTLAAARKAAAPIDIKVVGERRQDDTVPGEILDQDPAQGRIKENRALRVILSLGPTLVSVPDLTDMSEEEARARLAAVGFKVVGSVARPYHDSEPKGRVLNWSYKGQRRPKGSNIALTVSNGPTPVTLPQLFTRKVGELVDHLKGLGLKVRTEDAFSDTVPPGEAITTNPAPGQQAQRDSEVTVVVSKGPERIAVPDVKGKSLAEARRIIEGAGLKVGNVYGPDKGRVFYTDPEAGTKVRRGGSVDVFLKRDD